ncbi:hypothetical protein NLI96_g11735 [Meripilus lineatus]|uniref:Uncharacterized protein n=1 Tax=Meripilus lineatus TaxID=2056292 RepID=A0AAD5UW45_9APHY|nr:hypothetical protein NLI96_g11735 [Physisporinus lineatus]
MSVVAQMFNYSRLAALVFHVCDIAEGFAVEVSIVFDTSPRFVELQYCPLSAQVEHIWRHKKSWTEFAYIFVRYYPTLHIFVLDFLVLGLYSPHVGITDLDHSSWMVYIPLSTTLVVWVVQIILVMRVYAMYERDTKILVVLSAIFSVQVSVVIVQTGLSAVYDFPCSACDTLQIPLLVMVGWISALGFETLLFCLTLICYYRNISVLRGLRRESIMHTIMRDGFWAYASVFLLLPIRFSLVQSSNQLPLGVFGSWLISATSSAGSHLILNLKVFGAGVVTHDLTMWSSPSLSQTASSSQARQRSEP